MDWPDEVVEKCCKAARKSASALADKVNTGVTTETNFGGVSVNHPGWYAQAALSAITLQDIAKLPEVKALVEALETYANEANWDMPDGGWNPTNFRGTDDYGCEDGFGMAQKALTPFTEASNG